MQAFGLIFLVPIYSGVGQVLTTAKEAGYELSEDDKVSCKSCYFQKFTTRNHVWIDASKLPTIVQTSAKLSEFDQECWFGHCWFLAVNIEEQFKCTEMPNASDQFFLIVTHPVLINLPHARFLDFQFLAPASHFPLTLTISTEQTQLCSIRDAKELLTSLR